MATVDEQKDSILTLVKNKSYNIFYGTIEMNNIVYWDEPDKWEEYLKLAEKENVRTIVYHEFEFVEEVSDLNDLIDNSYADDPDNPSASEFRSQLKNFDDSEKLAWLQVAWIKEGTAFLLQLTSPRFSDLNELSEMIHMECDIFTRQNESQEQEQKYLDEDLKNLDELTQEIVQWAKSKGLKKIIRTKLQLYLTEHKKKVTWDNQNKLRYKINEVLQDAS